MDCKYIYKAIALKKEQTELVDKCVDILKNNQGLDLSRSQVISYLCYEFIKQNAETKKA